MQFTRTEWIYRHLFPFPVSYGYFKSVSRRGCATSVWYVARDAPPSGKEEQQTVKHPAMCVVVVYVFFSFIFIVKKTKFQKFI